MAVPVQKTKTIKQTCCERYEPQGPNVANILGQSGIYVGLCSKLAGRLGGLKWTLPSHELRELVLELGKLTYACGSNF